MTSLAAMPGLEKLAQQAIDRGAQQKLGELQMFGYLVEGRFCETAIEIGTYSGATAWFLRKLGLQVTAVDVNLGNVRPENRTRGMEFIEGRGPEIIPTLPRADLIFIDGDHSLLGVTADWQVAEGHALKLVAFHDVRQHASHAESEVDLLWGSIRESRYATAEIIQYEGGHWAGIGAVLL